MIDADKLKADIEYHITCALPRSARVASVDGDGTAHVVGGLPDWEDLVGLEEVAGMRADLTRAARAMRELRGEPPELDLDEYAARLARAFDLPYDGTHADAERVLAEVEVREGRRREAVATLGERFSVDLGSRVVQVDLDCLLDVLRGEG